MKYVEVAVNAPIGHDKTLSYSVPSQLDLEPGQMVWVPLGTMPVQGIVFQHADQPQVDVVKGVIAPVEPSPLLTHLGLRLARWISRYYMSSLFESAALMLPPGFENRVSSYVKLAPQKGGTPTASNQVRNAAVETLLQRGEVKEREMVKALGGDGEKELRRLLRQGSLRRRWELPRPKASHRYDCYVRSAASAEGGEGLLARGAHKQNALYRALAHSGEHMAVALANKEYGTGTVAGLLAKGLLALEWIRVDRQPTLQLETGGLDEIGLALTSDQHRALAEVMAALEGEAGVPTSFLLHGVTGSGKTEVYLRALERCVAAGKRGIFLVPEIALTPQTVHRLNARFPGRVALLHSRLTKGEQFDQWWRIRDGDYDVVVGPRSALFAPLGDLGLIVIDEEHEWTYKQQDVVPRYHGRQVALKLAELAGAVVVMGSATPDVETYYAAASGKHRLLGLPRRVARSDGAQGEHADLPTVEVCDMRTELREGNRSIISRALATALRQCVDRGEQSVLFLNRRGAATLVQCRDCGFALRCRRCSVTLTYHALAMRLLCHQCNRRSPVPGGCPQCRSPRIRYLGLGTQRVMEELQAAVARCQGAPLGCGCGRRSPCP